MHLFCNLMFDFEKKSKTNVLYNLKTTHYEKYIKSSRPFIDDDFPI